MDWLGWAHAGRVPSPWIRTGEGPCPSLRGQGAGVALRGVWAGGD